MVPVPLMVGVVSPVMPSPTVPESLVVASVAVGAAGAVVSTVKPLNAAWLWLPAGSVMVVLVVQAPSCVNALVGTTWVIEPAVISAAVSTVVSVVVVPSGAVTTVVTVSPMAAFTGSVVTIGVPPKLATSAALTKVPSVAATVGADGAVVSMVTASAGLGSLTLPAGSVTVVVI